VQHFTRFRLTVCSHGSSALGELLVLAASVLQYKREFFSDVATNRFKLMQRCLQRFIPCNRLRRMLQQQSHRVFST